MTGVTTRRRWVVERSTYHVPKREAVRLFRRGPPPHIGWWNASCDQNRRPDEWRWWDGEKWSKDASRLTQPEHVAAVAHSPERHPWRDCIVWSDYWPEGARVQRMVPELQLKAKRRRIEV